jgi:hypothetical protein
VRGPLSPVCINQALRRDISLVHDSEVILKQFQCDVRSTDPNYAGSACACNRRIISKREINAVEIGGENMHTYLNCGKTVVWSFREPEMLLIFALKLSEMKCF